MLVAKMTVEIMPAMSGRSITHLPQRERFRSC
jgi:hypothetical protein